VLVAGTVVAGVLVAGAVVAGVLVAGTVVAGRLVGGVVVAGARVGGVSWALGGQGDPEPRDGEHGGKRDHDEQRAVRSLLGQHPQRLTAACPAKPGHGRCVLTVSWL
jgi:hypothetical protein